jgi:hypothetical protein
MRTIKQYPISSLMDPIVEMPRGAKILKLAHKKSFPLVWAEVNTERPLVKRLIRTFETNEELIDEPGQYLGTVEVLGKTFHCFDGGERV